MDVLRAALGEQVMTYFGAPTAPSSARRTPTLFPERVGAAACSTARSTRPSTRREAALAQAKRVRDRAAGLRAELPGRRPTPASSATSLDEGLQRIRDLLDQVDDQPLATSSGRPLTLGLAVTGIITPLYDRGTWIVLSQALRSAFDGDGSTLLALADAYSRRQSDGTYATNLLEAFPAISCLDDPTGVKPAEVPAMLPEFEEASPTFGESFAWGLIGCRNWPPARGVPPEPLTIDGAGAPPIVVVGTTRDPATPLRRRRRRWPPSWTPVCWSPATATATRLQRRQRLHRRRRRVLPHRGQGPAGRAGLLSVVSGSARPRRGSA